MSDERRRQQRVERQRRRRSRRTASGGSLPAGAFDTQLPGVFGWFQRNGRLFYIVGITVMLVSLASFFISQNLSRSTTKPKATPTATASATATPSSSPTATATSPGGKPTWAEAPAMSINPKKRYEAVIRTEKGDIRVQLLPDKAPVHTNNFVFLAQQRYYDGLTFHRVIAGFVAQGGDPGGTGGPGYVLPDEPNDVPLDAGVIAMARSDKTNGSQFFVTLEPQPQLKDAGFSAFGKVIEGLDVARKLTLRDPQKPNQPPGDLILTIEIRESGG